MEFVISDQADASVSLIGEPHCDVVVAGLYNIDVDDIQSAAIRYLRQSTQNQCIDPDPAAPGREALPGKRGKVAPVVSSPVLHAAIDL